MCDHFLNRFAGRIGRVTKKGPIQLENWVLPANQMEFSRKLGLLDEKRRRSGNFGSKLNFKWSLYLKDRKETDPGETSNNRILVVQNIYKKGCHDKLSEVQNVSSDKAQRRLLGKLKPMDNHQPSHLSNKQGFEYCNKQGFEYGRKMHRRVSFVEGGRRRSLQIFKVEPHQRRLQLLARIAQHQQDLSL